MQEGIVKIDPENISEKDIKYCAGFIRNGELVAFPTETVYGLGASAFLPGAIKKIFLAKNRPQDNPLIVHIYDYSQLKEIVKSVPEDALRLMQAFWPGPLTFVLPKSSKVPDEVSKGLGTVAVRMPGHPVARALIKAAGPIVAPSANLSGKPSTTDSKHVIHDLQGKIACIIDSGKSTLGLESTVILCTKKPFEILRLGFITEEDLRQHVKEVVVHQDIKGEKPLSPGMKYRHYAPDAEIKVFSGPDRVARIREFLRTQKGKKLGLVFYSEELAKEKAHFRQFLGKTLEEMAHSLYESLRLMDEKKVELIVFEGIDTKGLGAAIMNRIYKAAGEE
jgi:L-threonylcarbamoyladenylate synthase